jgi:hypothetical protein
VAAQMYRLDSHEQTRVREWPRPSAWALLAAWGLAGPENMMSLPARQQRALDRIEKTLMADDPRFGSLFAIFTRLTWHEAMPGIELAKSGRWHSLRPFAAIAIALIAVASVLMLTLLAPRRPICLTSAAARHSYSSGQTAGCLPGVVVMQERQYIH